MRARHVVAGALVIGMAGAAAVGGTSASASRTAGDPPALFSSGPTTASRQAHTARQRTAQVDLSLLPAGRASRVRLDLFDDTRFDTTLQPFADDGLADRDSWRGRLDGVDLGSVLVVRKGTSVSAVVSTPGASYSVRTVGDHQVVREVREDFVESVDDAPAPPAAGSLAAPSSSPSSAAAAPADGPLGPADEVPTVDVLVAYTPAAESEAGGASAIQGEAASAVAVANDAYVSSGVNGRLRLAGTVRASSNVLSDDSGLGQLTDPGDGVLDELQTKRVQTGADIVSLLTGSGSGACGIGWQPNALDPNQAGFMFNAVEWTCAVDNKSFAHEVGHNLSIAHDRFVADSNTLFPYAYGYVNVSAGWRTIMAYNNACQAASTSCTRLPYFSNPAKTYNGLPLGKADGDPQSADNHKALNISIPKVARYRSSYRPFGSWNAFVNQQYQDLVGRAPTSSERSTLATALAQQGKLPAEAIAQLARGAAFGEKYSPVIRLYFAYFLRAPELGGLDYWVGRYKAGTSLNAISQSFATSSEFKSRYGNLSNQAFVEKVYQNVLGRPGEPSGVAYWTGQLDSGKKTRGQVMVGFSEATEYKNVRKQEVDTILFYRGLLRRVPTASQFDDAVYDLEHGTSTATFIDWLVARPEYASRITP